MIFLGPRGVAQLVARNFWEVEVAGSSPVAPTKIIQKTREGEIFCGIMKLVCGYRITAIMYPSQGWDWSPTLHTRTKAYWDSLRLFLSFLKT